MNGPNSPINATNAGGEPAVAWRGRHLAMMVDGRWEYATRTTATGGVGVIAVTDDRRVLLVEQHRPPVGVSVIEIPAGLVGDIQGAESETILEAARRELLEETGYEARNWIELGRGFSSPGMTNEAVALVLATGLVQAGSGGGDDSEEITLHSVPLEGLRPWLDQQSEAGRVCDMKLLAGLYLAEPHLNGIGGS